jgi:hypothetical protein
MPPDRCIDCIAHSGIQTSIDNHTGILKTIDERFWQIMIGIFLCLITTIFSTLASFYVASIELKNVPLTKKTSPAIYSIIGDGDGR